MAGASWAPRLPAIKHASGLGDAGLGVALTGLAVGLLVGTRLAPLPVDRLGSRPTIRLGTLALCAALLGPAFARGLPALAVSLALFGVVSGVVDVAMNAQAVAVERGYRRPIMSGLHGLWSVGGLLGAGAAAAAAALDVGIEAHLTAAAIVLAAASIPLLRGLLERADEVGEVSPQVPLARRRWSRPVLALGLIGFAAFVGEGSAADWSAVYLRDGLGASPGTAASGFAAFSVAMAASRFSADRLVARFGPAPVVRAGGLLAAGGLGLGLAVGHTAAGLAGFALLGAGLAPVFPTAVSAAGALAAGRTGAAVAQVATISYLGTILGPIAIGFTAHWTGLRAALAIPAALAVLVAASAGALRRRE